VTGAIVGIDTSTPATATAVLLADGRAVEAREDPAPGTRPGHTGRLLALLEQALAEAGVGWDGVERLAVGVGPGGFTGLRIGIATARALAQARGLALVGVSSLRALAAGAEAAPTGGVSLLRAPGADVGAKAPGTVLAAIDARRGEAFAAAWADARRARPGRASGAGGSAPTTRVGGWRRLGTLPGRARTGRGGGPGGRLGRASRARRAGLPARGRGAAGREGPPRSRLPSRAGRQTP